MKSKFDYLIQQKTQNFKKIQLKIKFEKEFHQKTKIG